MAFRVLLKRLERTEKVFKASPVTYARTSAHRAIQTCTEGSNPFRSATQSGLQRKSAPISPEIRETCPYFAIIQRKNRTAENGLLSS